MDLKRRMAKVIRLLKREYPEAECSLLHRNAFELLVATILSAQCTDSRVNKITPALFTKYGNPHKMVYADINEIEKLIRSAGFFRNKARSIKAVSGAIVEQHGGDVPNNLEALMQLKGVGRKTANVVLANAFGIPAIAVDTHVGRLCRRIGFTKSNNAVKIEYELMELVRPGDWIIVSHLLIQHGRKVCTARRAYCERCVLSHDCDSSTVR